MRPFWFFVFSLFVVAPVVADGTGCEPTVIKAFDDYQVGEVVPRPVYNALSYVEHVDFRDEHIKLACTDNSWQASVFDVSRDQGGDGPSGGGGDN